MDAVKQREKLIEELDSSGSSQPAPESIRRYLKLVRELNARDSSRVAKFGSLLLTNHKKQLLSDESKWYFYLSPKKLGNLEWEIYEQVAIACMDIQANRCAQSCVSAICKQFPNSIRAAKLKAMLYEATDNLTAAESIYNDILAKDPTIDSILKRKVAICKTKGDLVAAAQALNTYLDTFMSDQYAWEELAELYLTMQMYRRAAHCYEELILMTPDSISYHIRYADTLYTIGTSEDIFMAQTYYSHALEQSGGTSLRALYGSCLCISHPKNKRAARSEVGDLAAKVLVKLYGRADSPMTEVVKEVVRLQGFRT